MAASSLRFLDIDGAIMRFRVMSIDDDGLLSVDLENFRAEPKTFPGLSTSCVSNPHPFYCSTGYVVNNKDHK